MGRLSRRVALRRLLGVAAAPLGLGALEQAGVRAVLAQEAPPVVVAPPAQIKPAASSFGLVEPGHYFYTLAGPHDGPLKVGVTRNSYGTDIGYTAFEDGSFVMHLHYNHGLLGEEWIGSRIGSFSIEDGALMVDVVGELDHHGCFGLEMRHQAYKDRKYIRSNWLMVDPPTQSAVIETDGIWNQMTNVGRGQSEAVRSMHEWQRILFIAYGQQFEGWVNGVKVVEGHDYRFGQGRISLVTERMNKAPFRARFNNLHVWDGVIPDPTSVWG